MARRCYGFYRQPRVWHVPLRLSVAVVGTSSNYVCTTCSTVAMGKAHPSLLGHHNSNGTTIMSQLPVAIEGYGPLLQRRIVVVVQSTNFG
jgi:hypothetical protein